MKIQAPRGTNDWYGARGESLERIEELAVEVFRRYGFRPIRTPIFEVTELFQRHIGETSDVVLKEMYTFQDRKGRSLTLRPEGTAPVVRALVERSLLQEGADRLFYCGPMFRYERPQAGRYRQHYQLGVEAFGDPSPELDAEVIDCFLAVLRACGLRDLEVRLNSVGTPESRERYNAALREYLEPRRDQLNQASLDRLERNPMRILDEKDPRVRALLEDAPGFFDHLDDADRDHFEAVKATLTRLDVTYTVDPFLVRGFDYYTRTAFEVVSTHLGAQDAIGGGGRYDLLVEQLGGSPTPGIGFATGLERILLTLEGYDQRPPPRDEPGLAFVVCTDDAARVEAVDLVRVLREAGCPARAHYPGGKVGKQLKLADRVGARYAVMLGSREREEGVVTLKDLRTGEQSRVAPDKLAVALGGAA